MTADEGTVDVPVTLADLLAEASALSEAEIALYRKRGQKDKYPGEIEIATIDDELLLSLFALVWHKADRANDEFEKAQKLLEESKEDEAEKHLVVGRKLHAEGELMNDVVLGILKIEHDLLKYEPYDGGWLRGGNTYVIERLSETEDEELEVDVELEDDAGEKEEGDPPEETPAKKPLPTRH